MAWFSYYDSDLEIVIQGMLETEGFRHGVDYSSHYPLRFGFILDFAFPEIKLAIEVDGDYWHSLDINRIRDRVKDSILRKNGWSIIRICERELVQSPESVKQKLLCKIYEISSDKGESPVK